MLNRDAIRSGAYLESFDSLPAELLWTQQRIEQSLAETLAQRPDDASDVWVFAYGSLMWNPLAAIEHREVAVLDGWHRSFCMRIVAARGSPQNPGRMLSLEPGGSTQGIALRLPPLLADEELRIIWIREMVTGAYRPAWARVRLADGTVTHAIAFVANPAHPHHEADSRPSCVAPLIARAAGSFGSNAEYVFRLQQALAEHALTDAYIDELTRRLSLLAQRHEPTRAHPDAER